MIKHKQVYRHQPENGVYGDCVRTVMACLLDRENPEDVPHFGEDGPPAGVANDRLDLWLRGEGYARVFTLYPGELPLGDLMRTMGLMNPGVYWMLSGQSRNKCNHVVVCLGDAVYWDTSLDDSGIVAPVDDGFWWVEVLVPLQFTEKKAVPDAVRLAHRPGE